MPIYEYRCISCGRTVELLQRVDEPPATECPHCQGEMEKLFSAPSFHFKGSGWYATDYGKRGGGETASDEGSDSATASDSPAQSTDSKSADRKSTGDSTASTSTGS